MMSDENGEGLPLPGEGEIRLPGSLVPADRMDSLLPADPETGVVAYEAFCVFLGSFLDLVARHGQPLTLLTIAPDPSETLRLLGPQGARLIGAAIARCLRQETRLYDVIGRGPAADPAGPQPFMVILPMMTEALALPFAERLRSAMTISTGEAGRAWLTLSVGIASFSLETDAPDLLILRAQEALASARRCGGDRVWSHADTVRRILDRDRPDSPQE